MEDKHGKLDGDVFSYQITKEQKVLVFWYNKLVTTLRGPKAQKFIRQIADLETHDAQLLMAKVTGNFKRGNERQPSRE